MHELSIALNIIDIVMDTFAKTNAKQVNDVELEIGKFAGVEIDALEFALETSIDSTQLKSAKFIKTTTKGIGICNDCKKEIELETLYDNCPYCRGFNIDIIQGQELRVKSINVN